jgi:hypothetical protein
VKPDTPLAERLAAAHALPHDTPVAVAAAQLAELRSTLADGLDDERAHELRAFASLAHRFDHHADVWNATQLLDAEGPLDPHARRMRAEAWLALFPDAARRRPQIVQALVAGDPPISDPAFASLLTMWVRQTPSGSDAAAAVAAAEDLIAAHLVAVDRWPDPSSWLERAPAFAAGYVEVARQAASSVRDFAGPRLATIAPIWATALELADATIGMEDDGVAVVEDPTESPAQPAAMPNIDPDILRATGARLGVEKRRIWVVGGLKAKWHDLLGSAKRLGVPAGVFAHVEYAEVKQKPMMHRINVATDVGVLVGPVPHSAMGIGSHGSLVSQLQHEAGLPVVELRANSQSKELVITKQSFKTGLLALLTHLAVAFEDARSVVAVQALGPVEA